MSTPSEEPEPTRARARPRARRARPRPGALALALVAALGAWVYYVHSWTWDVALWPSATPEKVVYGGRDYEREGDAAAVERGFVERGRTMGGGAIYAPAGHPTPTGIDVVDGSRVVEYALLGGP